MDTLSWLKILVGFDTVSRLSNLALIEKVQAWLQERQIESHLSYNAEKSKANLFATIPAADGGLVNGLVLSGHTDVVPVDGQQWETPPFELTQVNERLYGRGTSDMKGFIAVVLALIPEMQSMSLNYPIHIALSFDEEVGCLGAPLLIAEMRTLGIKPRACIVGEPTSMQPIVAHKGIQSFRCRILGCSAHSSLTNKACNAIEYAAQLICHIRHVADDLRLSGPVDPHFDVGFTSVSVNMIKGGIAHNTIPDECEFIFEFRQLPSIHPDTIINRIKEYAQNDLQRRMREEYQQAEVMIESLGAVPSFETSIDEALLPIEQIKKVAYATEAGLFEQAKIPTIVCGPGSIEQAHRANEYIELAQLRACEEWLKRLITSFAS